jgi:hypothetical protein
MHGATATGTALLHHHGGGSSMRLNVPIDCRCARCMHCASGTCAARVPAATYDEGGSAARRFADGSDECCDEESGSNHGHHDHDGSSAKRRRGSRLGSAARLPVLLFVVSCCACTATAAGMLLLLPPAGDGAEPRRFATLAWRAATAATATRPPVPPALALYEASRGAESAEDPPDAIIGQLARLHVATRSLDRSTRRRLDIVERLFPRWVGGQALPPRALGSALNMGEVLDDLITAIAAVSHRVHSAALSRGAPVEEVANRPSEPAHAPPESTESRPNAGGGGGVRRDARAAQ